MTVKKVKLPSLRQASSVKRIRVAKHYQNLHDTGPKGSCIIIPVPEPPRKKSHA